MENNENDEIGPLTADICRPSLDQSENDEIDPLTADICRLSLDQSENDEIDPLTADICSLSLDQSENDEKYDDIPILKSLDTIKYIKRSKVMIIMKGLPGSGKSSIVQKLTELYPNSTICSSDGYFQNNLKYTFDQTKLSEAHAFCQKSAVIAAVQQIPLIVIDNTNVRLWEMKFYLDLAEKFKYITLVVEPRTPWRKNIKILAEKNSHGVSLDILKKKIRSYESLYPLFSGFFLNEDDSELLVQKMVHWILQCMKVSEFAEYMKKRIYASSSAEVIHHFSKGTYPLQGSRLLHCTARYSAKEDPHMVTQWLESDILTEFIGKVTTLEIVGFTVTQNTIGAKVSLTSAQLQVWCGNDEAIEEELQGNKGKRYYVPPQGVHKRVEIPDYLPGQKVYPSISLEEEPQDHIQLIKNMGRSVNGRRAHITLGTTSGVAPVETGRELLALVKSDTEAVFQLDGATLICHKEKGWTIWPHNKLLVDTLFSMQL